MIFLLIATHRSSFWVDDRWQNRCHCQYMRSNSLIRWWKTNMASIWVWKKEFIYNNNLHTVNDLDCYIQLKRNNIISFGFGCHSMFTLLRRLFILLTYNKGKFWEYGWGKGVLLPVLIDKKKYLQYDFKEL